MAGLYYPDQYAQPDPSAPDVYARLPGVPAPDGMDMRGLAALADAPYAFPARRAAPIGPDILVNPSTQQWKVNDFVFDTDDDAAALESERLLSQPGTGETPPGWQRLTPEEYSGYLQQIKDPTLGRLAKKNFGRGVDIQQMLLGRGLQFLGAEETGGHMAEQQFEDLRKTSPYERQFTDIGSAHNQGPIDWLVANFAQQGPNLIESIATGLGGYAAGAGLGGTAMSQGGQLLAKMSANTEWKAGVTAALNKKLAGEALEKGEEKLLREAAGLAGAVAASTTQNTAMGVADIYGEARESGAGPGDHTARLQALAGSIPYGLLETMPEFVLASRYLNPGNIKRATAGMSLGRKAGEYARRAGVGLGVGGALEGTTEAGQELLVLGANPDVDYDSPEGIHRLVNSFAAGFGIGGPIGAGVNLRGGKPVNILQPDNPASPVAPPAVTPPSPQAAARTLPPFLGGDTPDMFEGGVARPGNTQMPLLPGEVAPPNPDAITNTFPQQMPMTPPATDMGEEQGGFGFAARGEQENLFAPPGPTTATQMPLLPGEVAPPNPDALAANYPQAFPTVPEATEYDPNQGALQFAPPAPEGSQFSGAIPPPATAFGQQLAAAQQREVADEAYNAREAAQATAAERLRTLGHARMAGAKQEALIPAPLDLNLAKRPAPVTGPGVGPKATILRQGRGRSQDHEELSARPKGERRLRKEASREAAAEAARAEAAPKGERGLKRQAKANAAKEAAAAAAAPEVVAKTSAKPAKPQGGKDALQKRGAKAIPARKPPGDSEAVGRGVSGTGEAAGTQSLKRNRKKVPPRTDEQKQTVQEKVDELDDTEQEIGEPVEASAPGPKGEAVAAVSAPPPSQQQESEGTPSEIESFDGLGKIIAALPEGLLRDELQEQHDELKEQKDARAKFAAAIPDLSRNAQAWYEGKELAAAPTATKPRAVLPTTKRSQTNEVLQAINTAETGPTLRSRIAAMGWMIGEVYDSKSKPTIAYIKEHILDHWLNNDEFRDALVIWAREEHEISMGVTRRKKKGEKYQVVLDEEGNPVYYWTDPNPMLEIIERTGMFQLLKNVATYEDLPPGYVEPTTVVAPEYMAQIIKRKETERVVPAPATSPVGKVQQTVRAQAAVAPQPTRTFTQAIGLSNLILMINGNTTRANPTKRAKDTRMLQERWALAREEGTLDFVDPQGNALSAYFDENGGPKLERINGRTRVVVKQMTPEELVRAEANEAASEKAATEAKKAASKAAVAAHKRERATPEVEDDQVGTQMLEEDIRLEEHGAVEDLSPVKDWNVSEFEGREFRDDGTPITAPVSHGRVVMAVRAFVTRLYAKPLVHVHKDQADFQKQNPTAYARAVAAHARGEEDFNATSAVGYSFGSEIVIFSNRVATTKQLKFVLAHESLGHYGFRALMSEKELNAALNAIYQRSQRIQSIVKSKMAALKIGKLEATEEYLADFAGTLESNLLSRFWNSIKNTLNKVGVTFDDDMARYLVSQSRAYVRNGATPGSFIDFHKIAQKWLDIETLQDPLRTGRFAVAASHYDLENRLAVDGSRRAVPSDFTDKFQKLLKDKGINAEELGRRVKNALTTMNYQARENLGFRAVFDALSNTTHIASSLRSKYNAMMSTVLQPAAELPFGITFDDNGNKATRAKIDVAGRMLNATSRAKGKGLSDHKLRNMPSLVYVENGEIKRNQTAIDQLKAQGRYTIEQFRKGFTYSNVVAMPMADEYKVELEKLRAAELAEAAKDPNTKPEDIAEINASYDEQINSDTYNLTRVEKFDPVEEKTTDLTEDSLEWKMYLEVRDTMDEAAIDMLEANISQAIGHRDEVLRIARAFLHRVDPKGKVMPLFKEDEVFIARIEDKYHEMRMKDHTLSEDGQIKLKKESTDAAREFMAKFNEALLADRVDAAKIGPVQAFFDSTEKDDVHKGIAGMKAGANIAKDGDRRFKLQQAIENLSLYDQGRDDAQLLAKRSIVSGHVPFGREGDWQVRINVVDPDTGRVYKVDPAYRQHLLYMQMNKKSEAVNTAEFVNKQFEESNNAGKFQLKVLDPGTNQFVVKTVRLVAQAETARQTPASSRETNLNEVIATLTQHSITLHPAERERLVVALTGQNHRARARMQRSGTPGEDPNVLKFVSQQLEATASAVARKHNRHILDRLFDEGDGNSERLWYGNEEEYTRIKKAHEDAQKNAALTERQKEAYKYAFVDYHFAFKVHDSKMHGNAYKDDAKRLMSFLDAQKDVEFTDFGSGEVMSQVRLWTTFVQMGLSPATALLNYLSLGTNVVPSLAGYNEKNGFGGGFGWAASSAELMRALGTSGNDRQSDVKYWKEILNEPSGEMLKALGYTRTEAEFMLKQVGSGPMQAAQTNSLLGTSRGKFKSGIAQGAAKKWMFLFNYSEQMSRRATGLSAFRLALAREMGLLKDRGGTITDDDTKKAVAAAERFAVKMIDDTLGQYAMFNRPAMFRGGVGQFIFMYKMFPVNTIQMLKALPRWHQIASLGMLMFFAGMKGLPFFEDIMDVLDTIAQGLGLGPSKIWKGSAEQSVAELFNWLVPGVSPYLMRGMVNHYMPVNISDRVSLGNIVPGTGIFHKGADVGRELIEIGGPFASFLQGSIASASDIAKLAFEPSEAGAIGVLRESPVTAFRAMGDVWAYHNSGAIVNRKGYIVSNNLHMGVFLTRLLGFYPSSAVENNDVVRLSTRIGNYRKDVAAHYYSRYISAKLSHDQDEVNGVLDDVVDWNDGAAGTGLELPHFQRGANRALKEARRTTTERYLRTIPRNTRREAQHVMDLLIPEGEQEDNLNQT